MNSIISAFMALLEFVFPKKQKNLEELQAGITYPGHMAFANKGGEYFHGCRVEKFKSIDALNNFFLPGERGHLKLVAEILPQVDGSIVLVYTNKLSAEDMENVEEFSRNMHSYFQNKNAEREAAKQQEKEAKAREEAETKRFADIGRKYEARTKKIKEMAPGIDRKRAEKQLNSGSLDE